MTKWKDTSFENMSEAYKEWAKDTSVKPSWDFAPDWAEMIVLQEGMYRFLSKGFVTYSRGGIITNRLGVYPWGEAVEYRPSLSENSPSSDEMYKRAFMALDTALVVCLSRTAEEYYDENDEKYGGFKKALNDLICHEAGVREYFNNTGG